MLTIAILLSIPIAELVQPRMPEPQPAAEYITRAFNTRPLVAFSEPGHGVSGTSEFFASLIRHPGFAGTVNDIVIECGNGRYQNIADRYFAGESIQRDEIRQIWENTTIVSGVWQQPMYEEILADIRAFNMTLPERQRIRVLLGDPPIDWSAVRGPADEDMNDWRDAHFAWVVQEQVLKKGRKALLWIGGAHTSRRVVFPDSLIHLLDRRLPNGTLVVHSINRNQVSASVMSRLIKWPSRSILPTRNTWLGQVDVREIGHPLSRGMVRDDIDAVLFWDASPSSGENAPRQDDVSEMSELRRRQRLAEATLSFRGGRIRFSANDTAFSAQSTEALSAVLAELRRDPTLNLLVKAFADAREPNRVQLSLGRARAVVAWLTARGVDAERLAPIGCGAARALWVGATEEQRAANRRAELVRNSPSEGCVPPRSFALP